MSYDEAHFHQNSFKTAKLGILKILDLFTNISAILLNVQFRVESRWNELTNSTSFKLLKAMHVGRLQSRRGVKSLHRESKIGAPS